MTGVPIADRLASGGDIFPQRMGKGLALGHVAFNWKQNSPQELGEFCCPCV